MCVLVSEGIVLERWKEYFVELTNEENEGEIRTDEGRLGG